MRGLQLADLELATRALLLLPACERPALLARLLDAARRGAAHHATCGTAHPAYGTGTLMSALSRVSIAPRPPVLTRDYLPCLAITIADATDHTFDIGDGILSGLQRTP